MGLANHSRRPRLTATLDLAAGEWLGFVKYTVFQRDIGATAAEVPGGDFDEVAAASAAEWARRWETSQIEVSGDPFAEQALRFAAFQLIGGAPRSSEGAGVGARLLSGYGYRHHVFWDADIFVVPYLTMTQPDLARAHLGYRYRGLDGARRKAARYGKAGAFFAWESAGTGDEVTPDWGETPDGERIRIRTGEIEEHIVADVAYAIDHYLRWTDDQEFLTARGAEMTLDGARYWQDRAEVDREGRAHLRNVIGPDEYHVGVDDNFFTNAMAAWHLRNAVEYAAGRVDLESRLSLPDGWEEAFLALADGLEPSPGPDGVFEQHDGYFDLDDVDLSRFEPRGAPLHAIFGEKRLQRSQITKQADVVMGLVLLDALQRRELIEANLDYYGVRTDHGSSLSLAMHSLAASMADRPDQAYDYFRRAAAIDLEDSMLNSHHGIHAATQGGLLQAALMGFGGLHLGEDGPRPIARLPDHWDSLGFSFVHRGTRQASEKSEEASRPVGQKPHGRPQRRRISMRHRTYVVLVLLLALIAACGDGGGADTTTAGATETTTGDTAGATTTAAGEATTMAPEEGSLEGVELSLWGWSSSDAENTALSDLVAQFSEETGAVAAFQPQAEYDVALQAALTSGDPPDVFYVDSFRLPDLADSGALAPVPEGAERPRRHLPVVRKTFTFNGTWYCPPKDFSTLGLVYDPAVLEAAGVAVPTTWEELAAAAETLTTGDAAAIAGDKPRPVWHGGGISALGGVHVPGRGGPDQRGRPAITLDTPEAREAIEYVAGLYQDGCTLTPAAVDAGGPVRPSDRARSP